MTVTNCPRCQERGKFLGFQLGAIWLQCKAGHVWDEDDGHPHPLAGI